MKIRFTYLQKKARPAQASVLTIRAKNTAQQQASAKNRRLALQMEKRLSAMAALKLKKVFFSIFFFFFQIIYFLLLLLLTDIFYFQKSIRQRLGIPNPSITPNIHDRLSLPGRLKARRARMRGAPRGRSLRKFYLISKKK